MFNNIFKNFISYSIGPDIYKEKKYRGKKNILRKAKKIIKFL